MKSELELKVYDKTILYFMYISIFDIDKKYLKKVKTKDEIKREAEVFFRQDMNFELLKEYYGDIGCSHAKWDKSH